MSGATSAGPRPLSPGDRIGFIGVGRMGGPMAGRLADAGYDVVAHDTDGALLDAVGGRGVSAASSLSDLHEAAAVVLMLPDSTAVEHVLGDQGLLGALPEGTLLVDMGSSRPTSTRALAQDAAEHGVVLVDAPVSGGVKGAEQGTLTVMVGGEADHVAAVAPLLEVLGSRVHHVGPSGAGHLLKSLNNLMSATHLLVTSEAVLAAERFGIDPAVMLDVVNTSSGRSGSTENKWPNFVLPGSFDSGFGLRLMVKDMGIALQAAREDGAGLTLGEAAHAMWKDAAGELDAAADHTEIVRWLRSTRGDDGNDDNEEHSEGQDRA